MCVAFMSMHLGFSCVQKTFKIRLGADQILLRIFQLLLEYTLLLLRCKSISWNVLQSCTM
jgi:hypothetical protein